ncbi:hypothetical protein BH11BAC6_BH11BAC6_11400 [soil metagenome]
MSVEEMKEILKSKFDTMPDDQVEKIFPKIIETIENVTSEKIDLKKYIPGILDKYDELMKKLA